MNTSIESHVRTLVAVSIIPLLVAVLSSLFAIMEPNLAEDSAGYLDWQPYRGVVYPLFLELFHPQSDGLTSIVTAQTFIFAAAAICLAYSFALTTESRWMGVVLAALLSLSPTTYFFNNTIMAESLYQSASCLFLAALVLVVMRKNMFAFVTLGISAGLMAVARPVGVATLPVLVFAAAAVYFSGQSRAWLGMVLAFVCSIALMFAEELAYKSVHGPERESVFDNVLFAKSGMFEAGESPYSETDPRNAVWNFLENDEARAARQAITDADDGAVGFFIMHSYEADMLFTYKSDELQALAAEAGISPGQMMREVGTARIQRNPLAFLGLALQHYWGHWQPFYYSVAQDRINAYINDNSPLPMNNASDRLTRDVFKAPAAGTIHLVLALGWIASMGLILVAVCFVRVDWKGRDMLNLAGLAALTFQGQVMITSLFSIASVRYLSVLWPMAALAFCALAITIANYAIRRHTQSASNISGSII